MKRRFSKRQLAKRKTVSYKPKVRKNKGKETLKKKNDLKKRKVKPVKAKEQSSEEKSTFAENHSVSDKQNEQEVLVIAKESFKLDLKRNRTKKFLIFKDDSRRIELKREKKKNFTENSVLCKINLLKIVDCINFENMYLVNSLSNKISISIKTLV